MHYVVEEEASTVEEAVEIAAKKLDLDRRYVDVKVISEKKGFLGLLKGAVRVRVRPSFDERLLYARDLTRDILKKLGIDAVVTISVEEGLINVDGEPIGLIIGYHGSRLLSLQYIVNFLVRKRFPSKRTFIWIDANGYRRKRENFLTELAKDVALDVRFLKRKKYLPPMLSWERKIVHLTVAGMKGVRTMSVGKEPNRRVCIFPQR